jgi:hypothetical protein
MFLKPMALLASFFDPRLCGEKTASAIKIPAAPILPFIAPITPVRLRSFEP